jgi:hypothetical protein
LIPPLTEIKNGAEETKLDPLLKVPNGPQVTSHRSWTRTPLKDMSWKHRKGRASTSGPVGESATCQDSILSSTFITGTLLEEDPIDGELNEFRLSEGSLEFNESDSLVEKIDLDRYFEEFRMASVPVWDSPLPSDITTSVRWLRQALRNPVYYWRLHKISYSKTTHASEHKVIPSWKKKMLDEMYKKALGSDERVSNAAMDMSLSEEMGEPTVEVPKDEDQPLEEDPGLRSPVNSEWSGASLDGGDTPRYRQPIRVGATTQVGKKRRQKKKKRTVGGDDMEDLRNTMRKVHYKLQLLEAELGIHVFISFFV